MPLSSGGHRSTLSLTGLKLRPQQGWFLLESLGQNLLAHIFQPLEAADGMAPALHHFSLYRISCSVTLTTSLLTRAL